MNIKDEIRDRLENKRLSISTLEKEAGLKKSAVSNILLDRSKKPSYETIKAIAKVFECSPEELIGIPEEEYNNLNTRLPEASVNKQIQWKPELYSNSVMAFNDFCEQNNQFPKNYSSAISLIYEIYNFHLQKKTNVIDSDFVEWIAKRLL